MTEEKNITVVIAERPYRLTIENKEEENVRKAVRLIEQKVKEYSDSYSFNDKQDLLAMVALQFTTSFLNGEHLKGDHKLDEINNRVRNLITQIDEHLQGR